MDAGPVEPPIEPMLAKPADTADLAAYDDVAYEPKWDGFRCLAFHLPTQVVLQGRGRSRDGDGYVDLAYAFPEIVDAVAQAVPPGTVIDGEIVVRAQDRLDFAALTGRLRPRSASAAASIARLAQQQPATLLAFDLLARGTSVMELPFGERSNMLADLASTWREPLLVTPRTQDRETAAGWFHQFESSGVDGLIVKPLADPYRPGVRAQWKVKHRRTADVVVAGWRSKAAKDGGEVVASLLLGMYDEAAVLHYVGGTAAFTDAMRRSLVAELAPLAVEAGAEHPWSKPGKGRVPGGATRWGAGKSWHAVLPVLVAEVAYDQFVDGAFRHPAAFIRWRPDRDARSCGLGQLPEAMPPSIGRLLDSAAP